jgi:hypothetical protein
MPKYSVHDVTKKRVYKELFEPNVGEMLDAPDAPVTEPTEPILIVPDQTPVEKTAEAIKTVASADPETVKEAAESLGTSSDPEKSDTMGALHQIFKAGKPDPSEPEATSEDIKVLMTRWSEIRWPDPNKKCRKQGCSENGHVHPYTTKQEGKSLLLGAYDVESSKELRKPQVEFLYGEFGKVLAGLAYMARDGQNTVYIATPHGTTEEEVRKNVLKWE